MQSEKQQNLPSVFKQYIRNAISWADIKDSILRTMGDIGVDGALYEAKEQPYKEEVCPQWMQFNCLQRISSGLLMKTYLRMLSLR